MMKFIGLYLLSFFLPLALCMPEHGNNKVLNITNTGGPRNCTSLTMLDSSVVKVKLRSADLRKLEEGKNAAKFNVTVYLFESQCEALDEQNCNTMDSDSKKVMYNRDDLISVTNGANKYEFVFSNTESLVKDEKTDNDSEENTGDNWFTFKTIGSGVYDVIVIAQNNSAIEYSLIFDVDMRNSYGYLSLVDYPAMIVYSILLVLYVLYAFVWLILMAIDYKDLVRLQFWILAVILLGFLEKVFFVAEYGTANIGLESSGLIYIAEGVSAAKRALARILIIIVCEGFGTVKPRLGNILTKVMALGVIYFICAFIDGVLRAAKNTNEQGINTMLTFGILFLLDTAIVYWIFSALISTRRALRIRKNLVKLSLYNHLGYALIATVVASVAFIVWQFIYITRRTCTNDWRELWLLDCFWHMLFCFVLLIVMMIWRPSANKLRFAYTQVNNEDSEEEDEQGPNKNFENVKMRSVNSSTKQSTVTSIEAEEDLKWVEENLPTTAIDKAAQLVLDSEEEVMTTRFESSKIN